MIKDLMMVDNETRFKSLVRNLQQFDSESVIIYAIKTIRENFDQVNSIADIVSKKEHRYPWHVMLIIRWVFRYVKGGSRRIDYQSFRNIYAEVHRLSDSATIGKQKVEEIGFRFFQRTLFFQLPYQIKFQEVEYSVARQILIFCDTQLINNSDSIFRKNYDISIYDFLRILFFILIDFESQRRKLYIDKITICKFFDKSIVDAFFKISSLDLREARIFIEYHSKSKRKKSAIPEKMLFDYQLNEHSPLELKPFFRHSDKFIPYCVRLLSSSIINNVYDHLKRNGEMLSSSILGPSFERYVGRGIDYLYSAAPKQKIIKNLKKDAGKSVDFIIRDDDSFVLVEAKSAELNSIARVLQTKDSLIRNLKDNVIKGFIQIIESSLALARAGMLKDERVFGLIVTFKEYLIGDCGSFWDEYIGEIVKQKFDRHDVMKFVDPSCIFVISIADFDYLVAGVKEQNLSLAKTLGEIADRNRCKSTRSLLMRQHLEAMWNDIAYVPDYIVDKSEELIQSFSRNLR